MNSITSPFRLEIPSGLEVGPDGPVDVRRAGVVIWVFRVVVPLSATRFAWAPTGPRPGSIVEDDLGTLIITPNSQMPTRSNRRQRPRQRQTSRRRRPGSPSAGSAGVQAHQPAPEARGSTPPTGCQTDGCVHQWTLEHGWRTCHSDCAVRLPIPAPMIYRCIRARPDFPPRPNRGSRLLRSVTDRTPASCTLTRRPLYFSVPTPQSPAPHR